MDTSKLRVKVGVHEFEAEGPAEHITAQYQIWKEMIATAPQSTPAAAPKPNGSAIPASMVTEVKTRDGYAAPWDIFNMDESDGDLMVLRVHPPAGDTRDADAILLVMYGYRKAGADGNGVSEVPVTTLKRSLEIAGLRVPRIDRAVAPYLKAGYLLKTGSGKGGKYRLTVTGFAKAEEMAHKLISQLV